MATHNGAGGSNGKAPGGKPTFGEMVYDWNAVDALAPAGQKPIQLFDETLRDGLQSPSVIDPPLEKKLELLDLMDELGIGHADVGLPGAGARQRSDVLAIARHLKHNNRTLRPAVACRTVVSDIEPAAELQQQAGMPIEVYAFIGSSPIRQLAEGWDAEHLLRTSEAAVAFCVKEKLPVVFVTEDTTRSHPATLDRLFRHAVELGADALCLCDTVGWATPDGVDQLLRWTRALLRGMGAEKVRVEWHGHNDRGLALANTLQALRSGADRLHGCALGIGERVGNTPMDLMLLNLKLLGLYPHDLTQLVRYVRTASAACGVPIPRNYPLSGDDAFRTATGVHASAIIKAEALGDRWLADSVYSGVPASWFGKEQVIEIGPMSGLSNVNYWLKRRGFAADEGLAKAVLQKAKESNRTLSEEEVLQLVQAATEAQRAAAPARP
jgi:2-isopropylmalate synthase